MTRNHWISSFTILIFPIIPIDQCKNMITYVRYVKLEILTSVYSLRHILLLHSRVTFYEIIQEKNGLKIRL